MIAPIAPKPKTVALCTGCARERTTSIAKDGAPKTPMGWKKIGGSLLCSACKSAQFITRNIRLRITGLAEGEERCVADMRAALTAAGKASARFGNWYLQRLYAKDQAVSVRPALGKDGREKLAACPEVDCYRDATIKFPELAPASIVALAKMLRGWYRERRFEAFILLNRSVENYRFGYLPIEIPKQAWSMTIDPEGKIEVKTQIGPGRSWRLKVYVEKRDLANARALAGGEIQALGLKLLRRARQVIPGETEKRKAWFLRAAVLLPRKPARQSHQEITLTLGHDAGALWFGSLEGNDEVFEYSGVLVKSIIERHDVARKRRQESESRIGRELSGRTRRRRQERTSAKAARAQQRITAEINLACAVLVRWCIAHNITSVDYDAAHRGFTAHFPYRRLADMAAARLENTGIALHRIDLADSAAKTELALAGPKGETDDEL